MLQTNTEWPWSSQACATSGIEIRHKLLHAIIAFALFTSAFFAVAEGSTIQVGQDIQSAISSSNSGDIIIVGPGDHNAFEVDRPLTIVGQGAPLLHAAIQKPAIRVNSDGVKISGFKILGSKKDTTAKFDYYMQNPAAAAGQRLDQPNAAIIINGNDFKLINSSIFGAQVGLLAENVDNLTLQNTTMDSCDAGVSLMRCSSARIEGCDFSNCKKYGLDIESSRDISLENSSIENNNNAGVLLKESDSCTISGNVFSKNTFGLSLWNSSFNQVKRNQADHNYYGFLVTDWSCNNTLIENLAEDNSRSEIVKGFGIGISLQENSSYNLVVRNTVKRNFNGLEVSKRCKFNAVYDNNASENSHGIRLNENRNNLIFGNNFYNNNINAYENTSLNIWNTTIGNYYSDYHGKDQDSDGIGDQPYALPGPESKTCDHRPLISPYRTANLDLATLKDEVKKYANYEPAEEEVPLYRVERGTVVISSHVPTSPPKWSKSKTLDLNIPPT
jgi:nitrous oxidase accessory protein